MKICIEVSGGMVQNVYAIGGEDVTVLVADYDVDDFFDEEDAARHEETLREFERMATLPNSRLVW